MPNRNSIIQSVIVIVAVLIGLVGLCLSCSQRPDIPMPTEYRVLGFIASVHDNVSIPGVTVTEDTTGVQMTTSETGLWQCRFETGANLKFRFYHPNAGDFFPSTLFIPNLQKNYVYLVQMTFAEYWMINGYVTRPVIETEVDPNNPDNVTEHIKFLGVEKVIVEALSVNPRWVIEIENPDNPVPVLPVMKEFNDRRR